MLKNVEFKLAQTREEIEAASALVCSRYRDKDYLRDWPYDIWITPFCLHPSTSVILAFMDGEIVGTGSIFRRNEMGLPLFNLCPEAESLGPDMFEIGKLAVDKKIGENLFSSIAGIGLIMGIFSIMYRCGLWWREVEFKNQDFDMCIAVVPSHRHFYSRLGFRALSSTPGIYRTFKDVQAYCMAQSFEEFLALTQKHPMLRKFFGPLEPLDPTKRYVLTWGDVEYFAKKRTNLWDRMEESTKALLARAYGVKLEL